MARRSGAGRARRPGVGGRIVDRDVGHVAMIAFVLIVLVALIDSPLHVAGYTSIVLRQRSISGAGVPMMANAEETVNVNVPGPSFPIGIFEDANQMNPAK